MKITAVAHMLRSSSNTANRNAVKSAMKKENLLTEIDALIRAQHKTPDGLREFAAQLRKSNWKELAKATEKMADEWERDLKHERSDSNQADRPARRKESRAASRSNRRGPRDSNVPLSG
jgi:hypothetical protein